MDDPHDGAYAREPQVEDLARLGRALNTHQVRYVLTKNTGRPADAADRQFLQALLDEAAR